MQSFGCGQKTKDHGCDGTTRKRVCMIDLGKIQTLTVQREKEFGV